MNGPNTNISSGSRDVAVAGTQVTLVAASTPCREVIIQAKAANTDFIYVGGSDIAAGAGVQLDAREAVTLDIHDAFAVRIDAGVSGEGVTYIILGGA